MYSFTEKGKYIEMHLHKQAPHFDFHLITAYKRVR